MSYIFLHIKKQKVNKLNLRIFSKLPGWACILYYDISHLTLQGFKHPSNIFKQKSLFSSKHIIRFLLTKCHIQLD